MKKANIFSQGVRPVLIGLALTAALAFSNAASASAVWSLTLNTDSMWY